MSSIAGLCFILVVLGVKGFTKAGLPLTTHRRISGCNGMIVGTLCVVVGLSGLLAGYWTSGPRERPLLRSFYLGVAAGITGMLLIIGPSWFTSSEDENDQNHA